ncbi:2-diacylglycerol 3-beta-galactosyltransferase family protein [Hibiscus syriacus]|uniref:2-diacylglycerol 3-beta-galactosyltransferase family protein n=1 Tax=Hibiscus syriacus TaxID=106335 RepID=A0A6A2ZJ15_HIBSY|nr:uncharacterized protein LOC120145217 [Hibiscus syriacus]KAE8690955.1 2-diacylglycerol 3-beta-galactosyltransferase family protein [Hibiscus syriacus]
MVRGKLILIFQHGGEFVPKDDGSLSYSGGEAHALDISPETEFDDLKYTLAETCNLEYRSLTVKYFLPGNRRTLITLSNDKDLKRMYDFHGDSVTADVFITGTKVVAPVNLGTQAKRKAGAKEGCASAAGPATSKGSRSDVGLKDVTVGIATPRSPTRAANTSKHTAVCNIVDGLFEVSVVDATDCSTDTFDMSASPGESVKKRRRTDSWRSEANGLTIVPDADNLEETRQTTSWKKVARKCNLAAVPDNMSLDLPSDASPVKLVEFWKNCITGEGQDFESVVEFRDALQKYAIAHRFGYKLRKNDTNRASAICAAEGCPWRIHASWVPSDNVFRVKKLHESHTCDGESWKTATPAKNWLVNIIKDRLRDSPHHKPKEIANGILRDFGLELNYAQVWRGIEDAREQLQGSYKEAYGQLPWYCEQIEEANPGSFTKLLIGDDRRFHRLFISFHATVNGFQSGCRPLLFLEAIPLKSKYHEILLTATALDGDDGIFPVAFAVVDNENEDSWRWFLEQLKSAVSTSRSLTFVSDRDKRLMKHVLEIFENAHHGYSIYYLMDSFIQKLKGPFHGEGRASLPGCFLAAAKAVRHGGFKTYTEQIKRISSSAYDWIMQNQPEYWANAFFKGELYSHITLNIAESYADWIEEARELPIMQKLEVLRCTIMKLMEDSRTESSNWTTKLTPLKQEMLQEKSAKTRGLKVLFSTDTLFEVHDNSIHVVDIIKQHCSCAIWKPTGLPCHHAIAVFNSTGGNVYDYCSRYFTVDSFRSAFAGSINPASAIVHPGGNEEDDDDEQIMPPCISRPLGQQQKKIRRNKNQGIIRRSVCCTRCKGVGHNKASCKVSL